MKPDPAAICELKGHQWEQIWGPEGKTQHCRRCGLTDRSSLLRGLDRFITRYQSIDVTYEQAVRGVMIYTRPRVLQIFDERSCVATTRVAQTVLKHFGVASMPMSIRAQILNPAATEMVGAGKELPAHTDAEYGRLGLWGVALGYGPEDGDIVDPAETERYREWLQETAETVRHVGLLVSQPDLDAAPYLLDASLDQASRPEHNINLDGAVLLGTTPEFLLGAESPDDMDAKIGTLVRGSLVIYEARPDDRLYETSPDWHNVGGRLDTVVAQVIDDVNDWVQTGAVPPSGEGGFAVKDGEFVLENQDCEIRLPVEDPATGHTTGTE